MDSRPNILLFMTDHQRADSLFMEQCGREVTPNLNRLAREGMVFERAYDTCPLCVPARTALATGVYPTKNGVVYNDWKGVTAGGFEPLHKALQKAGYETVQAFSGTEARMLFQMDKAGFSLILLDLMLPGISGEEVLAQIRKQGNTPVIVLTAKDGLDEKIGLLTSGADDYITKPFEIQEVLARIQVQLRHMQQEPEHKSVSYKNLELDRERFEVRIAGVLLPKITKQEFAILELLLEHPKQVFSKEEIFEYAWDEHYMGETKTLDVHISNIRKKIKAVTQEEYIDTVWGIGYRLHS